jgi:Fis family transcriptional regulator
LLGLAAPVVVGLQIPVTFVRQGGRASLAVDIRENKMKKSASEADNAIPLRQNVQQAIRRYLEDMGQCQPECLYRTLMAAVEPPLIEEVLRYTQGNQSQTARILGMTRNTLRAKLNRYDIPVTNGK